MGQCASRMAVVGAKQAATAQYPAERRKIATTAASPSKPSSRSLVTSRTISSFDDFDSSSGSLNIVSGPIPTTASIDEANAKNDDGGNDGLSLFLDVYPLVLVFLPPAEVAQNLPICRFLRDAALTALPTILADDLRPALPKDLARLIDASPDRNDQWTKLAREWRSTTFVVAADALPLSEEVGSSDDEESDDADDEDSDDTGDETEDSETDGDDFTAANSTAAPATALEAFLSMPDVRDCLVDGCDPAAFAAWLHDKTEDYRGLGDINFWLKTAYVEDRFEDETDDGGPYVTLTQGGLVEAGGGVGVRPERYRDFANLVLQCVEGLAEHFLYAEITGSGGTPLCYSDGTPLIMWIDAFGRGVGPNKVTAVNDCKKNQKHIEKQRVFAPRCTCPNCNEVILPRLDDHMGVNTTSILMEEPYLVKHFRGCEKDSYGRMIISEGDLNGLAFSRDEYPPSFGDGVFSNDEESEACSLPSLSSLDQLFEITLKAVAYHPDNGPSSVTVLHRSSLKLSQTMVQHEGDRSGAVKYTFQTEEEGGEICAAVSFINVAKLSSFANEPFECDARPKSNQLWIDFWDVQLFTVKEGSGTQISRSDLFWKCRQLLCDI